MEIRNFSRNILACRWHSQSICFCRFISFRQVICPTCAAECYQGNYFITLTQKLTELASEAFVKHKIHQEIDGIIYDIQERVYLYVIKHGMRAAEFFLGHYKELQRSAYGIVNLREAKNTNYSDEGNGDSFIRFSIIG